MKVLGFLLLLAGWGLALAAIALLSKDVSRAIFVYAGVAVEIAGMVLVVRSHPGPRGLRS